MTDLRILLVEDVTADAELTEAMLLESLPTCTVARAPTLRDAVARCRAELFDVAIVDLSLPDAEGLEAVHGLVDEVPALVVLTGSSDDGGRRAQESLSAGAQDHLPKSALTPFWLGRSVHHAALRVEADRELRAVQSWAQSVLDSIDSPTCALDADGRIVAVNISWRAGVVVGGADDDTCGPGTSYVDVCRRAAATGDALANRVADELVALLRNGSGLVEIVYPCAVQDETRWFRLHATPSSGRRGAVVSHVDVTALVQAQASVELAEATDPLTGLPHRRSVLAELEKQLARLAPGAELCVALIDVHDFAAVNHRLGHAAGDAVLVRIGAELVGALPDALVGHLSGDDFVIVSDCSEGQVPLLVEHLQAAVAAAGEGGLPLSARIGAVLAQSGDSADDLLLAAESALEETSQHVRDAVLTTGDMRRRATARATTRAELRVALDEGQLELHYQPITASDGSVHALEALLRWQHPTRGLLSPAAFLDVAEESDLIVPMGALVLEQACAFGQQLALEGLNLSIAVNVSARQLNDPHMFDTVRHTLDTSGFPPGQLIVEITETAMIEDHERARQAMLRLKAAGVQLAIDDFGTGYSSLSYLKRYPVDGVKIDRSFVRDMVSSSDDRAIVSSVLRLAADLDLWVVAEGVETAEQRDLLRHLGCRLLQGYLVSRPVPAGAIPELVQRLTRGVSALHAQDPRRRRPVPLSSPEAASLAASLLQRGASLATIAAALNAAGIQNPNGLRWHPRSVARLLSFRPPALPVDPPAGAPGLRLAADG